jgi:hypothetical protein
MTYDDNDVKRIRMLRGMPLTTEGFRVQGFTVERAKKSVSPLKRRTSFSFSCGSGGSLAARR